MQTVYVLTHGSMRTNNVYGSRTRAVKGFLEVASPTRYYVTTDENNELVTRETPWTEEYARTTFRGKGYLVAEDYEGCLVELNTHTVL